MIELDQEIAATTGVKPYRLTIRVQNNCLLRALEERFGSIGKTAMAQQMGVNQTTLSNLINMHGRHSRVFVQAKGNVRKGTKEKGELNWSKGVLQIAKALGKEPAELFDVAVHDGALFATTVLYREVDTPEEPMGILAPQSLLADSPDAEVLREEATVLIEAALKRLPPREERIIRHTFGIGVDRKTVEEIARTEGGLSRGRVHQIIGEVLRRLRRPGHRLIYMNPAEDRDEPGRLTRAEFTQMSLRQMKSTAR